MKYKKILSLLVIVLLFSVFIASALSLDVFHIDIQNSISILHKPNSNSSVVTNPIVAIRTYLDEACTEPFTNNSWGIIESSDTPSRTSKFFYLNNTGNVPVLVTYHIDGLQWNETWYKDKDGFDLCLLSYTSTGLELRLYEGNTVWYPTESIYCNPRTLKPNQVIRLQLMIDILPNAPSENINFKLVFYASPSQ